MVHFVGAGPGAPDLITLRGAELVRGADIIIALSPGKDKPRPCDKHLRFRRKKVVYFISFVC